MEYNAVWFPEITGQTWYTGYPTLEDYDNEYNTVPDIWLYI